MARYLQKPNSKVVSGHSAVQIETRQVSLAPWIPQHTRSRFAYIADMPDDEAEVYAKEH